jgi:hypothetical protein
MNNAMSSGIAGINDSMTQQLMPGQVMQNVGNQRTLYDQSLIDADKARFDWNRQESNDTLNRLMGYLNLGPQGGQVLQGQSGSPLDALMGFVQGTNMYNTARGTPTTTQQSTVPVPTSPK